MAAAAGLPPGYRFYPTEEELICFYLRHKLDSLRDDIERVIPVVHVYTVDPWQLPGIHEMLCGGAGDGEPWFYFCPRQEREARGGRPSRTTPSGYWKAAGTPGVVYSSSADRRAIGMKKTMVFYRGRAPSGTKTKWKMNEYRALQYDDAAGTAAAAGNDGGSSSGHHHAAAPPNVPPPQLRSEFSLCRLYTKSGSLRQFDRRPLGAAAGVPGDDPGPSTAAAASPPDDDDGSGSSMQQQQLTERGANDPYGDDVAIFDALLYWPGD
ncbi:hypothetical protein BS78_03G345800 [Paspalum vaginatum]|nr:hypothetical protein BS78_03G345800 [Paspalum vaginatum]